MYNEIAVKLPGMIDELSRKEAQQLLHVIIDGLLFKEGRGQGDLNDDLTAAQRVILITIFTYMNGGN